jgi:hypothetical protein
VPSKITVDGAFGLRGVMLHLCHLGKCTSHLAVTFNKNALTGLQTITTATCKVQQVMLKPGDHLPILVSNLSGATYRATSPSTSYTRVQKGSRESNKLLVITFLEFILLISYYRVLLPDHKKLLPLLLLIVTEFPLF